MNTGLTLTETRRVSRMKQKLKQRKPMKKLIVAIALFCSSAFGQDYMIYDSNGNVTTVISTGGGSAFFFDSNGNVGNIISTGGGSTHTCEPTEPSRHALPIGFDEDMQVLTGNEDGNR